MRIPWGRTSGATVLVVVAAACGSSTSPTATGGLTLNFAIVSAFSGPSAIAGQALSASCWPAIKVINQAGGVLGDNFTCIPVDTKGDPADAIPAVSQLLATHSNIVGVDGPDSAAGPATVPILAAAHIPMFANAGQAQFDKNTNPYFYRDTAPDDTAGFAQALWAQHQGYTRVALLYATDPASQGDKPGAVVGLQKLGIQVVADIGLTPDQPSYRSEATNMLSANPQAILTESDGPTAVTFFTNLAGLNGGALLPTIGSQATGNADYIQPMIKGLGLARMEKYFYFMGSATPPQTPALYNLFQQNLGASGNEIPNATQWESNTEIQAVYDGLIVIALAIQQAKSINPVDFNPYIRRITESGAGKVVVNTFASGKAALLAGKQIQYVGLTGAINFNQYNNSYGDQTASVITSITALRQVGTVPYAALNALGAK